MSRGFTYNQGAGTFEDIPDTPSTKPQPRDYEPTPLQRQAPEEPKKELTPRRERFPGKNSADNKKCPLTKEQRKTKPLHSKDPDKWYRDGGNITIDKDKTWTYNDSEGNSVAYPGGYPDFKAAGMVKQEVDIGKFEGYNTDMPKADRLAPNGPIPDSSTWHHHQDGKTMQEVDTLHHDRFKHRGGMSITKKKNKGG